VSPRALVLTGSGAFADPWHDFAANGERIADLVRRAGATVEIDDDVAGRLSDLSRVDLLVAVFGEATLGGEHPAPTPEPDPVDSPVRSGLRAYLERGGAVFASHIVTAALPAVPEWESALGARWIDGVSMHPPYGRIVPEIRDPGHELVAGVDELVLDDELYCALRLADDLRPVVDHEFDGVRHPLVWARRAGSAPVVVDLLGHDARSFEAPAHARLVENAARSLLRG
jgi:uncharacterized protein